MSSIDPDRQKAIAAAAPKQRSLLPWLAAGLVLLLLAGGIGFAVWQNQSKKSDTQKALENVSAPPNANADKSGIVVNPGKAKAGAPTVVLYQDYQCPACKSLEDSLGPTLEKMATDGKIALEYHTMTFLDGNVRNDASQRAGEAAACADVVGAYAKYHDTVYKNQPEKEGTGYTDEQLRNTFAKDAGITGTKLATFQQCLTEHTMKNWVIGTDDKASKAKITSTPAIKVNGKPFALKAQYKDAAEFESLLLAAGK